LHDGSILSDDFIRELINVGQVDILVAVPTYNHGQTVGQVVQAVRAGLLQCFPRARAVIINADGGSTDGTQDLVRAASISDANISSDVRALRTLHSISTQYEGGPAGSPCIRFWQLPTYCKQGHARWSRQNPPRSNRSGSSGCCARCSAMAGTWCCLFTAAISSMDC
jgi:glycosyltransferase involved in cell wall biosynthesis